MRRMQVEIVLAGAQRASTGIAALSRQLRSLENSPAARLASAVSRTVTIPSGPEQRLVKAREALHQALQNGTRAEIADAQAAVERMTEAVTKQRGRFDKTIKLPTLKVPKPFSISGPNQKLEDAQKNYRLAVQSGIQKWIDDAAIDLRRAEERLTRANRPAPRSTLGGRLANAVLSTRVNLPGIGGVGASPLVGRTLAALGATGGAALAISASAVAVAAFAAAVREGTESLQKLSGAATISGGSARTVAGFGAAGIDSGSIASLAAQVRQARSSNPFAAAQFGYQLPRPFGDVDEAKGLQSVINKLAGLDATGKKLAATEDKLNTYQKRLTAARLVELDSIIPTIEAIRRQPAVYAADLAARTRVFTEASKILSQDVQFQSMRRIGNWELLMQNLGNAFGPTMIRTNKFIADQERSLSNFGAKHPKWGERLMEILVGGHTVLPAPGASNDPATPAARPLVDALKDLTGVLKGGTYGGADRARGTFPPHLIPAAASAKTNAETLRLGFWGIG